jgi:hypothetical protein
MNTIELRSLYPKFSLLFSIALLGFLVLSPSTVFGDVDVNVTGSNIAVTGTPAAESLQLEQVGDGNVFVTGLDGTTVNGELSFDTGLGPGEVNDISFDMKGGNDLVDIQFGDHGITGDFQANMGPGDDTLALQCLEIAGNANTVMGGGNDIFDCVNTNVSGNLVHSSGAGNDINQIGFSSATEFNPVNVVGDCTIRCAGGDDVTSYDPATTVIGKITQACGGGSDTLYFDGNALGDMDYNAGGAGDTGFFGNFDICQVAGELTIRSGGGGDTLNFGLTNPVVCGAQVDYLGGHGRDTVNIGEFAVFLDAITASMGRGNDTLNSADDTQYTVPGVLNGGTGTDDVNPDPDVLTELGFAVTNFEN